MTAEERDADGNTLLMQALIKYEIEKAKKLIKNGANINVVNNYGQTPLFAAVEFEDKELFKLILSKGPTTENINIQETDNGYTPLHRAAQLDDPEIFDILWNENTVDREVKDNQGKKAKYYFEQHQPIRDIIMKAKIEDDDLIKEWIKKSNLSFDEFLQEKNQKLQQNIDLKAYSETGKNYIMLAVESGDITKLQFILQKAKKHHINFKNPFNGRTALHDAVGKNNPEMIKLLINKGIDVREVDNNNESSLDTIVDPNYYNTLIKVIKRKLQAELDDKLSNNENSNLTEQEKKELENLKKKIINEKDPSLIIDTVSEFIADLQQKSDNIKDIVKYTELLKNYIKSFDLVVEKLPYNEKFKLMIKAKEKGNIVFAKKLQAQRIYKTGKEIYKSVDDYSKFKQSFEQGANIDYINRSNGNSILHKAIQSSNQDKDKIIQLLIDYSTLINHQNKDGNSALMQAIIIGDNNSLEKLLKAGAIVELTNIKGQDCFDLALQYNNQTVINLLKQYFPNKMQEREKIYQNISNFLDDLEKSNDKYNFISKNWDNKFIKLYKSNIGFRENFDRKCEQFIKEKDGSKRDFLELYATINPKRAAKLLKEHINKKFNNKLTSSNNPQDKELAFFGTTVTFMVTFVIGVLSITGALILISEGFMVLPVILIAAAIPIGIAVIGTMISLLSFIPRVINPIKGKIQLKSISKELNKLINSESITYEKAKELYNKLKGENAEGIKEIFNDNRLKRIQEEGFLPGEARKIVEKINQKMSNKPPLNFEEAKIQAIKEFRINKLETEETSDIKEATKLMEKIEKKMSKNKTVTFEEAKKQVVKEYRANALAKDHSIDKNEANKIVDIAQKFIEIKKNYRFFEVKEIIKKEHADKDKKLTTAVEEVKGKLKQSKISSSDTDKDKKLTVDEVKEILKRINEPYASNIDNSPGNTHNKRSSSSLNKGSIRNIT